MLNLDHAVTSLVTKCVAGLKPWSEANYRTLMRAYTKAGLKEEGWVPSSDGNLPCKAYATAMANILTVASSVDLANMREPALSSLSSMVTELAWQTTAGGRVWELALLLKPDEFVQALNLAQCLRDEWAYNASCITLQ